MTDVKEPTLYPGVDTIRRLQHLMILCSLLPPDGRLREIMELALSLPEERVLTRITPIDDLHPHAVKAWLESFWAHDGLSDKERELVDWQNANDNMAAALKELRDVERQLGIRLVAEKTNESDRI